MLPQPKPPADPQDSVPDPLAQPDLVLALEQELAAGFPPALALDLVLNELVVRAATATHAGAGALALKRGDELVCRAATGRHAPDLGIPLNTSDGVSGACLRTRRSQLCLDTETDPRVDADTCRRQGIRSMLVVPILDQDDEQEPELVGVLEVFSSNPAEFVDSDQNLLEIFARECNRIRRAALDAHDQLVPTLIESFPVLREAPERGASVLPTQRSVYEGWTLAIGALAIILITAFSFVIGSRIGWWRAARISNSRTAMPEGDAASGMVAAPSTRSDSSSKSKPAAKQANATDPGELVVYEQGKIVFRMKPAPARRTGKDLPASGASPSEIARVWLAADLAESRLIHRVEPRYPPEAQAAHRTGDVVIEVLVNPDGTIGATRALRGDPLLASAATEAIRNWRYQPYSVKGRPAEFETDVTLRFSLPE